MQNVRSNNVINFWHILYAFPTYIPYKFNLLDIFSISNQVNYTLLYCSTLQAYLLGH